MEIAFKTFFSFGGETFRNIVGAMFLFQLFHISHYGQSNCPTETVILSGLAPAGPGVSNLGSGASLPIPEAVLAHQG